MSELASNGSLRHDLWGLVLNSMMSSRALLAAQMDPSRSRQLTTDAECKYPEKLILGDYQRMWNRFGVARRVVSLEAEECWSDDPDVYESNDPGETPWEEALQDLLDRFQLWSVLEEADILSGIGCYSIILFGLNDGKDLSEPIEQMVATSNVASNPGENKPKTPGNYQLLYLKVFPEGDAVESTAESFNRGVATIKEVEKDPKSPRYGKPTRYTITYPKGSSVDIHWTRVLHVSESELSRLHDVYNDLLDFKKVGGGSAEMYWRGAFPGISFEVLPEFIEAGGQLDVESLRDEFTKYTEGLQRFLALTGVKANVLTPTVVDPQPQITSIIKRISIAKNCPTRVFEGSEQGQLASGQDTKRWNKRMNRRRLRYCTPRLIRPLIDALMTYGALPTVKQYFVDWVDLNGATTKEQGDEAKVVVETIAKYLQAGLDDLIEPSFFFAHVMKWDAERVKEAVDYYEKRKKELEDELGDTELDEFGNPIPDVEDSDEEETTPTTVRTSTTTTTPRPR